MEILRKTIGIVSITLLTSCTAGVIKDSGVNIGDGTIKAMNCDSTYYTSVNNGAWVFDPEASPPNVPEPSLPIGPLSFFLDYQGQSYGNNVANHVYTQDPQCLPFQVNDCALYDWALNVDLQTSTTWNPGACPSGAVNGLPSPDECPDDPLKTSPGECGCGQPDDNDSDGDGMFACYDGKPSVAGVAGANPIDLHLFMKGVLLTATNHWHKEGVSQCFSQPAGSQYADAADNDWGCASQNPDEWFPQTIFWKNYVRQNPVTQAFEMVFLREATGNSYEIYRFGSGAMLLDVESNPTKYRTFNEVPGQNSFTWGDRYQNNVFLTPQNVTITNYDSTCTPPGTQQSPFNISRIVGPYNISTAAGRVAAENAINDATTPSDLTIPSAWYVGIPKKLGYDGNVWMITRETYWGNFVPGVYGPGGNPNQHFRYEENYDYLCVGPAPDACRSVGIVSWRVKYHPTSSDPMRLLRRTVMNNIVFESTPILKGSGSCYTGP